MILFTWIALFVVTVILGIGVAFYIKHLYTTQEIKNNE
jgi:hypothetical protein